MKAVILAAGVGERLSPLTDKTPKCLLEVGGLTLLERHLRILRDSGVGEVVVVVGHEADQLRDRFGDEYEGVLLRYLHNAEYRRGSILSLWTAREELDTGAVIMDADVLYHPEIMRRLLFSDHKNCVLMDESSQETGEEMMLSANGGRVLHIARRVGLDWDEVGEGVGFFKLDGADADTLREVIGAHVERGEVDLDYERTLDEFMALAFVGYEKVGDLAWTEIDFEHDLERARDVILPRLPESLAATV